MAFDIEKMKEDGISPHLIRLVSMDQETLFLLIARRLENDRIFQQFIGESADEIETMYSYAVAAGLMSEEDKLWLIDEENPYKEITTYTVTFNGCTYINPTPEPITVNAGESITLPGHIGLTDWYDGGCDQQGNFVGSASNSYTPTSNVTLYAAEQEI